jgi:Zn-dependent protease
MFDLDSQILAMGVAWYAVFVFSTTLHEAGHAWAAYRLGDPTAYHGGQVSLNPLPHMEREPIGMVLVPILSFFLYEGQWMIGWASAPYDPDWADRYPRRAAWMAVAGPAGNLLLILISGILIRLGLAFGMFLPPDEISMTEITRGIEGEGISHALATLLSIVFMLNLILFTFNLIPLPPLDGSAALPLVVPERWARRYLDFMRQPGFGLLGLIIAWSLFPKLFVPLFLLALGALYFQVS